MMIRPPLESLLARIENKYALVVAVAKRARVLKEGQLPMVDVASNNPVTVSLEEIADIYSDMVLRGIWNPAAGQLQTHLRRVERDNAKRSLAIAGAPK